MSQLSDYLQALQQSLIDYYAARPESVINIELISDSNLQTIQQGVIKTPAIFIDVGDIEYGDEDQQDGEQLMLSIPIDIHCVLKTDTPSGELAILDFATQVASRVRCNEFGLSDYIVSHVSGRIETSPIDVRDGYHARIVAFEQALYIDTLDPVGASVPWVGYDAEHQRNDTNPDPILDSVDIP